MLKLKGLRSNKKGFLILEILVSVVIITVGLIYIIRSFSVSTRAIGTSRDYIKAISLLEEKLWELEEAGGIVKGDDQNYFGDDRKFEWVLSAELEDTEEEELPINRSSLQVLWKERDKKQKISVITYLWDIEEF